VWNLVFHIEKGTWNEVVFQQGTVVDTVFGTEEDGVTGAGGEL